jgi:hypothetical protein
MTLGLPDKMWLVEQMIAEATCAIVAVRWREVSARPGSEPNQRMRDRTLTKLKRNSKARVPLRFRLPPEFERPTVKAQEDQEMLVTVYYNNQLSMRSRKLPAKSAS